MVQNIETLHFLSGSGVTNSKESEIGVGTPCNCNNVIGSYQNIRIENLETLLSNFSRIFFVDKAPCRGNNLFQPYLRRLFFSIAFVRKTIRTIWQLEFSYIFGFDKTETRFFILHYQIECVTHYFLAICSIKMLIISTFHRLFAMVCLFWFLFLYFCVSCLCWLKWNGKKATRVYCLSKQSKHMICTDTIFECRSEWMIKKTAKKRDCFDCTLAIPYYGIEGWKKGTKTRIFSGTIYNLSSFFVIIADSTLVHIRFALESIASCMCIVLE